MTVARIFHLRQTTTEADGFCCTLGIDHNNPIYRMHFPGNPVTPGVCIIQACKELFEIQLGQQLRLQRIDNVKFLAVISPKEHNSIRLTFSKITSNANRLYSCNAICTADNGANSITFAKLKLTFAQTAAALEQRMKRSGTCLLIPTYNHGTYLRQVLNEALRQSSDIILVDDGSTDSAKTILADFAHRINIITLPTNRGKGYALAQGMKQAIAQGFRNVVTMDSDGQHSPNDLRAFLQAAEDNPGALITGARTFREKHMPAGNRFANRFSNFWFTLQTGRRLPDTQCGYRLYPLKHIQHMRAIGARYETELAWLLQFAWKNIQIIAIPIQADYRPTGERPSHYRRSIDFMRISLLNALMCFAAIFYGYPSLLYRKLKPRR
ncbi:MAG: glycosyltransferase [Tannerellaceae bacterium]|jgi:3-hydroxymyristoyl/3-hydroxydecanoyl-(acyl carrier protein) dehydratase|nr:glycosyltransferase [Tannerellaceae bacterium]